MAEEKANQKIKRKLIDNLQKMKDDSRFTKESFLRKYGWANSCDFPDCCWRWCKEIRGQTITVSLEDAVDMEKEIIEYQG